MFHVICHRHNDKKTNRLPSFFPLQLLQYERQVDTLCTNTSLHILAHFLSTPIQIALMIIPPSSPVYFKEVPSVVLTSILLSSSIYCVLINHDTFFQDIFHFSHDGKKCDKFSRFFQDTQKPWYSQYIYISVRCNLKVNSLSVVTDLQSNE